MSCFSKSLKILLNPREIWDSTVLDVFKNLELIKQTKRRCCIRTRVNHWTIVLFIWQIA